MRADTGRFRALQTDAEQVFYLQTQVDVYRQYKEEYDTIPGEYFEPLLQNSIELSQNDKVQLQFYYSVLEKIQGCTDANATALSSQFSKAMHKTLEALGITQDMIISSNMKPRGPVPIFIVVQNEAELCVFVYARPNLQDVLMTKVISYREFNVSQFYMNMARVIFDYISFRVKEQTVVRCAGIAHGASVVALLALLLKVEKKADAHGVAIGPAPCCTYDTSLAMRDYVLSFTHESDFMGSCSPNALNALAKRCNDIEKSQVQRSTVDLALATKTESALYLPGYICQKRCDGSMLRLSPEDAAEVRLRDLVPFSYAEALGGL